MNPSHPLSTTIEHHPITKQRLLSGDTPTGRLHLGHWVGSVADRVKLQELGYDCYFIIANLQAFTTRYACPQDIHDHVLDILLDYLAVGIDPMRSTIFLQSEIPAIAQLTMFFSMLISYNRLMHNPTIKDEIRDKQLGDHYPIGFLLYPVSQVADILAFRPTIVPVGEDQLPHLELTRELARRFNQLYCGVDPHTADADHLAAGGLFPIITPKIGQVKRLVGLGPPNPQGQLLKMSKSLNNAIFLSDDADTIQKKVMSLYTDPQRLRSTDKGTIINNPLWIFHDTFNPDKTWVAEAKARYQAGQIGDVACKKKLIEVLETFIAPIRQRRQQYANEQDYILSVLRTGTQQANSVAEDTLAQAKAALKQRYF